MVYKPPLLPHPVATNLKLFSLENWSVFHKWYPFLGQKPLISIPYRSLHCFIKPLPFRLASPQTSLGVRLSRIHFSPTDRGPWGRNECVTNEPQRTSAGRLPLLVPCSDRSPFSNIPVLNRHVRPRRKTAKFYVLWRTWTHDNHFLFLNFETAVYQGKRKMIMIIFVLQILL